jgi:hypothetical protein
MDEIEMMKAAFDSVSDALETSLNLNKAYLAKIAELEKCLIVEQEHNMMLEEQKPVASWLKMGLPQTPQTKPEGYGKAVPLTDDEKKQIFLEYWGVGDANQQELDYIKFIEEKVKRV